MSSRKQGKTDKRESSRRQGRGGSPDRTQVQDEPALAKVQPAELWLRVLLPVVVVACAFVTFLPALDAGFVDWDDDKVLVTNPYFRGFTSEHIKWMATQDKMGHYHPLTWASYGVDHAISKAMYGDGMNPKVYHFTNILLHAIAALGFYFLARMLLRLVLPPPGDKPDNGTSIAAALAALLFACHPLRVETVAWATERRDVLSIAFLLPCLLFYIKSVRETRSTLMRIAFYLVSLLLLTLSLYSKAWGITLPAVMILLDFYPLRRVRWGRDSNGRGRQSSPVRKVGLFTILVEKIPFFYAAVWFAMRAHAAQAGQLDTMKNWTEWTLLDRIAQAFYGLFFYSYKTLVPLNLSPLVAIPVKGTNNPFAAHYVVAAVVVVAVAVVILLLRKRWPSGVVLGLCYAGILSPVLGFSQSGPQLVADRYSYVACLTWALLGGGGLLWLWRRRDAKQRFGELLPVAGSFGAVVVVVFGILAWQQTKIWHDSESLWTQALKVDPTCIMAHTNLGIIKRRAGDVDGAIEHYRAVIEQDPEDIHSLNNLAVALDQQDRLDEALDLMAKAIDLKPMHHDLRRTYGRLLLRAGRVDDAIEQFKESVKIRGRSSTPNYPAGYQALGDAYFAKRDYESAAKQYRIAIKQEQALGSHSKKLAGRIVSLANTLMRLKRVDEAVDLYSKALEIDPSNSVAQRAMERLKRR